MDNIPLLRLFQMHLSLQIILTNDHSFALFHFVCSNAEDVYFLYEYIFYSRFFSVKQTLGEYYWSNHPLTKLN